LVSTQWHRRDEKYTKFESELLTGNREYLNHGSGRWIILKWIILCELAALDASASIESQTRLSASIITL